MAAISCPHCEEPVIVPPEAEADEKAGKSYSLDCPHCQKRMRVAFKVQPIPGSGIALGIRTIAKEEGKGW